MISEEQNASVNAARYALERQRMVDCQLRARGIHNQAVLKAFLEVPRELFVPPHDAYQAYGDHPVPIGFGQTVSQPLIVAMMIQALEVSPTHRVLDVGAGSGYQTALLAKLAKHVYAVERIADLTERASAAIGRLNITNVSFFTGDGTLGWPDEAPFDRIICGAAAPDIPDSWTDQLTEAGRIVLPVGPTADQMLIVAEKSQGKLNRSQICGVRFVKLIGEEGWPA